MTDKLTKLDILSKIDSGEITAEEGAAMLTGLDAESTPHKKETDSGPASAMDILEKIERGEISADDGVLKFQNGDAGQNEQASDSFSAEEPAQEPIDHPSLEELENDETFKRWRSFWQIPTWVGMALMIISSLWLFNSYENEQTFWFIVSWIPFLIGLLVTYIGWASRNSTWVHVRIKTDKPHEKTNISISIPLPLGIGRWALRNFSHLIPQLEGQSMDILMGALDKKNLKAPLVVDVDDDENEKVQIIIG